VVKTVVKVLKHGTSNDFVLLKHVGLALRNITIDAANQAKARQTNGF
jgi:hypothetical protein